MIRRFIQVALSIASAAAPVASAAAPEKFFINDHIPPILADNCCARLPP